MKPAYRAMACLLVLLLSAHGLRAAEPPHLVIEAPRPLWPLAERLRGVSPLAFLPVMELVGLEHPGPPILVKPRIGPRPHPDLPVHSNHAEIRIARHVPAPLVVCPCQQHDQENQLEKGKLLSGRQT